MTVRDVLETFAVLPSVQLKRPDPHRLDVGRAAIPHILQASGLTAGAEIGVERGLFSEALLDAMPDATLISVDWWHAYKGYREHVQQAKLDGFYEATKDRLARFGARSLILRGPSTDIAKCVDDGQLDFVYIDANHTLPHVIADLCAWVPKVRSGGVIMGHDYGRKSVGHVAEAVHAYTAAYGIDQWWVLGNERSPSFLWVQP